MNTSERSPYVKICCIQSLEEARMAIRYGASAIGLVSAMPSGPGVISEEVIASIASLAPPDIETFLLTSLQDADPIAAQHQRCRTSAIQLCDSLAAACYSSLRKVLPGVRLVQVIHVRNAESVREAQEVAPFVDALLLDSGNTVLTVKQLGGTGRVHDWNLSRDIREIVRIPVFLAGGLTPGNAADALRAVHPFGLDVCNGVRSNGALDESKLERFFQSIQVQADQGLQNRLDSNG